MAGSAFLFVSILTLVFLEARSSHHVTFDLEALAQLRASGLLEPDDADVLEEAYRFCERARNARYLQTGKPSDALPGDRAELERLAVLLGYVHQPHITLRDDYRRVTRRARRVVERVFYGAS